MRIVRGSFIKGGFLVPTFYSFERRALKLYSVLTDVKVVAIVLFCKTKEKKSETSGYCVSVLYICINKSSVNYLIEYRVLDNTGATIKSGTMRAKNKQTKFEAMAGLEDFLRKKVPNFHKLEVVSCVEEKVTKESLFEDMARWGRNFDRFNDFLNGK